MRLADLDLTGLFGVRELILAGVVLVVLYMLVMLLRIKSLNAQKRFDEVVAARYEADLSGHESKKKGRAEPRTEPSLSTPLASGRTQVSSYYDDPPRVEPKNKYAEPPERTVTSFDQEKLTRLERDLSATREELDALRTAFAQSRDQMRAEIERLKTGQRVSPSHGDAMQMALAGSGPEEIAARCGIARAEAELVLSLARGSSGGSPPSAGPEEVEPDSSIFRSGRPRYGSY